MKKTKWLVKFVALALCVVLLVGCTPAQDSVEPGAWEEVVARCGDHSLTNTGLSYYFWAGFAAFLEYYDVNAQGYLDLYKPLNEQIYSDDKTWEDYFIDNALTAFRQYCAVCDLAKEDGFALSQESVSLLENLEEELDATAKGMGFSSYQEYLQTNYGPGATMENYRSYMTDVLTVREYIAAEQAEYNFTDEEIEAHFDENAAVYAQQGIEKDDRVMASVRYLVLFQYDEPLETEALGTVEAGQIFDYLMTEWEESDDHSEAAFMKLGENWSNYGVVQNYVERMRPGDDNVEEIESWVFEEGRKPGDYLALESNHGYFLVYYVNPCDHPYWYEQSLYDLQYVALSSLINDRIVNTEFSVEPEKIVIAQNQDLYVDSSEEDGAGKNRNGS